MKTFSNAILAGLMIAVSLLPGQARAQSDPEPAIVICVAPLSEQMEDIGYLADASGFGQMSFLIKMQLQQFLKGIDTKKPSGVLLYFEEDKEEPNALGFLPLSNQDDFLNTVSQYAKVDEGDDLTTIVPPNGEELLMKYVDGIAYFSDREDMLENIPTDPAELMGDMAENYNVSARILAQRIPESMRESWLDTIKEGYSDSIQGMEGLDSDIQEKNFEMQMETMRSLINETEELTIGMSADADAESIIFDVQLIGLEGSKMATDAANQKGIEQTKYSGFLIDGAAFTANMCAELSEADAQQYATMIDSLRDEMLKEMNDSDLSDADLDTMEGIAEDVFGVLQATVEEGRIDGGMVVTTDGSLEFAMGMQVADAAKLEGAVKDLVKAIKANPDLRGVAKFNLDSGNLDGLRLHEIEIPMDEASDQFVEAFGEELNLLLGVGVDQIFLVGSSDDPSELLEKVMKPNAGRADAMPMMQYNLHLAPIMKMSAEIEGEELAEDMAMKLEESGRDRLRVDAEWIENGIRGRFEVQDGILQLIGVAAQQLGNLQPGGAEF